MLIEKNRFLKNENLIMRITLGGCEDAKIHRNVFIRNNEIEQKGVLAIYVSSKVSILFSFSHFFFLSNHIYHIY